MKILVVSNRGDGVWFVWLMGKHEGHKVDWVCHSEKDSVYMQGLIPPPLKRPPNPSAYDLIVYDSTGLGASADAARRLSPVIGGSSFADRAEKDRLFGLEAMEHAGIKVPMWEAFDSESKAVSWLEKNHKRCVFKPLGDVDDSAATYVAKDESDMKKYLPELVGKTKGNGFVLQEFIPGTEVSTEGWWNGNEWVAINHDLEEKKFLNDDLGPNTGCSGCVVWMPRKPTILFQRGLEKMAPILKEVGYVGPLDLNTIVTEGEAYGLEWTPRFGYEGTCNLTRLLPIPFSEFMLNVALGKPMNLTPRNNYCACVRISVPPYPNADGSRKKLRVPIEGLDLKNLQNIMLYDIVKEGDRLMTTGQYNAIGAPMALADNMGQAFDDAYIAVKNLKVPDLQYRTDVKAKCLKRYSTLQTQGWLRQIG